MDDKILAIIAQLAQINTQLNTLIVASTSLSGRVEKYVADLEEFAQRFEEVVDQLENERRLDWQNDLN